MQLSLDPKTSQIIETRVRSGQYSTPEDVVVAALHALEQDETEPDFAPGELDALIAEGDKSEDLNGDEVLAELRQRREAAKKSRRV